MAKQIINIGSGELTGDGESLRSAFDKINDNFGELYLDDTTDFDGDYNSLTNKPTIPTDYGDHSTQGYLTTITQYTLTITSYVDGNLFIAGHGFDSGANGTAFIFSSKDTDPTNLLTGIQYHIRYVNDDQLSLFSTREKAQTGTNKIVVSGTIGALDSHKIVDSGYYTSVVTVGSLQGYLTSYTETDPIVGAVTGIVKADGAGNISAAVAGTDYSTLAIGTTATTAMAGNTALFSGDYDDLTNKPTIPTAFSGDYDDLSNKPTLFDGVYDSLTSKPTLFSGDYDDLTSKPTLFSGDYDDLSNKPTLLQIGTSSTTALAGDTALFSGDFADISNKPTTLAGYGITDGGGSGLQSRIIRTNQTSSLADGAEEDLDITGFKAYALMAITTDKAARVRLYVKAASRTADAARAEGVDPTSDAGLIAEVITTGAETVIISPGAHGFNLETSVTTNIPCRVTNKSGSTDTVQVSLLILQLEA